MHNFQKFETDQRLLNDELEDIKRNAGIALKKNEELMIQTDSAHQECLVGIEYFYYDVISLLNFAMLLMDVKCEQSKFPLDNRNKNWNWIQQIKGWIANRSKNIRRHQACM